MFDLVISDGLCLIGDEFLKCNVGIKDEKICYVGREAIKGEEKINAEGCLVLPGFLNGHTHSAMTVFRGYAEGLPLSNWLEKIWKLEAKLDEKIVYIGAKFACVEMLKNGVTCFVDMYIHMDSVARAVEESGIRAVLGYGMADRGDEKRAKDELKIASDFIERWNGKSRIKCILAPHAVYTCTPEFLKSVAKMAREKNLIKHIHASETLWEVRESKKKYGMSPIELLNSIGFLDNNTVLAHGVWMAEKDLELISKSRASVVHCPSSNLKLSAGIAKVAEMIEKGINVCLGTDGAASNNSLNVFKEVHISALLQQLRRKFLNPAIYIKMATINGYKAYAIDGGSIAIGKLADLIVIKRSHVHYPIYNPFNSLVFSFPTEVRDVIVNGKVVVEDGNVILVDEEDVLKEIELLPHISNNDYEKV